jgi:glycosyltransferase involved in cell wall biosynthesis
MKISLCLIAWNELEGCTINVPELPRDEFDEVYAIDGGSTDGTAEYLAEQGIPVYLQPKKGLNAAYIHAVEKSSCDAIVVYFPKGTIDPSSVLQFRPLLESGYELIVASRNIQNARNEEDNRFLKPRKWAVLALAHFASFMWRREGCLVRDVLHGYKAFTISAFKRINPLDFGLSIDIEMVIRSYKFRLKRAEVPVIEIPRSFGTSHFKMLPTGLKLLKYLWFELRRKEQA